jgi:hypothetical protein
MKSKSVMKTHGSKTSHHHVIWEILDGPEAAMTFLAGLLIWGSLFLGHFL